TALVAGCAIYRPNRLLFSIIGRDRVRWLNGMVTNNIRDLAPGRGLYSFVLNSQGHILGDLYVFNRGESLIAEIESSQAEGLLHILKRYIIMDKVEIEDLKGKFAVLGVGGPKSEDLLASAGLDQTLEQETGQERALNYTKGCYIGQEIVERIRARGNVHKTFMGFEVDGPVPARGTKIQSGGKDVGELTSIAPAPLMQKQLAVGFIRR